MKVYMHHYGSAGQQIQHIRLLKRTICRQMNKEGHFVHVNLSVRTACIRCEPFFYFVCFSPLFRKQKRRLPISSRPFLLNKPYDLFVAILLLRILFRCRGFPRSQAERRSCRSGTPHIRRHGHIRYTIFRQHQVHAGRINGGPLN